MKKPTSPQRLKRKHRLAITLNDEEMRTFERLINKYHIQNRSRFIRQALIQTVLKQLDEDHPRLF